MTFTSETRNGVAIIKPSGDLVFHETLFTLRPKVRGLLDSGVRGFVFDLSEVKHCDSSGCGEIIGAYATICKSEGSVAFAQLAPRLRGLWDRIKVTSIFQIVDTVQAGVDSVSSGLGEH